MQKLFVLFTLWVLTLASTQASNGPSQFKWNSSSSNKKNESEGQGHGLKISRNKVIESISVYIKEKTSKEGWMDFYDQLSQKPISLKILHLNPGEQIRSFANGCYVHSVEFKDKIGTLVNIDFIVGENSAGCVQVLEDLSTAQRVGNEVRYEWITQGESWVKKFLK